MTLCLAHMRPWVQSPGPNKIERRKEKRKERSRVCKRMSNCTDAIDFIDFKQNK